LERRDEVFNTDVDTLIRVNPRRAHQRARDRVDDRLFTWRATKTVVAHRLGELKVACAREGQDAPLSKITSGLYYTTAAVTVRAAALGVLKVIATTVLVRRAVVVLKLIAELSIGAKTYNRGDEQLIKRARLEVL